MFSFTQDSLHRLNQSFLHFGNSPFQNPKAVLARYHSLQEDEFALISLDLEGRELWTAFEKIGEGLWKCFFLGESFLFSSPNSERAKQDKPLEQICDILDGEGLYFPLVDSRGTSFFLLQSLNCLAIPRLPSPTISWETNGIGFIERITENSKRSAERYWKKFEQALTWRTLAPEEAVEALDIIEKKSWKFTAKQSMHHRESQYKFYANWLSNGGIWMDVAEKEGRPVAYRLDAKVGKTLYALKYSYDEAYKKFSPGFYLLTKGIHQRWSSETVETIDLWGSPDTLKSRIQSGEYQRCGFFWPPTKQGEAFLSEREKHDQQIIKALNNQHGLKKIYLNEERRNG